MTDREERFVAMWENLRKNRFKFAIKQSVVVSFFFILVATIINYFIQQPQDLAPFLYRNLTIFVIILVALTLYYYTLGFKKYEEKYHALKDNSDKQ